MKTVKNTYFYFVTLPDRLYPFSSKVRGKIVRGRLSYTHEVESALKKYGVGHLSFRLLLYREVFHFIGAILFIISATLLSKVLFGSEIALYILLFMAIGGLTFQEFYLHPKRFKQRTRKGMADWFTWVLPMALYLIFFVS